MQYFEFFHEVRSEAKKVHDLLFDIMKISFVDTGFQESRSALTFFGSVASSSPRYLPPIGQSKRNKQIVDPEPEQILPQRPLSANAFKFLLKDVKVIQFSLTQDAFHGFTDKIMEETTLAEKAMAIFEILDFMCKNKGCF